VLLFVKYVSDKYAGDPNGIIEVPAGGSFADMVALKGDKEIGEKINIIIAKLAEANDLKGVIDVADFNDPEKLGTGKEMVDRLSNLVAIFNRRELDFRKNRAEGDDILGDAYEYLMRHFATESGKSKGQFYTPAEVSRIMAKAIGISGSKSADQTIYDPTCGSGTTAFVAEQWGRRWITTDTSRVALALARTRLMAGRFPAYLLRDSKEGAAKEGEITSRPPEEGPFRNDIRQGLVLERVPHVQRACHVGRRQLNGE
jgi:hypothetical protein